MVGVREVGSIVPMVGEEKVMLSNFGGGGSIDGMMGFVVKYGDGNIGDGDGRGWSGSVASV